MKPALKVAGVLALFFLMSFFNLAGTSMIYKNQPDWYFLDARHDYKRLGHVMGIAFGIRTFISNLDYISFLQYYGDRNNRVDRYKKIYTYIDDITNIDPNFTFAYTYGSAILAWNVERVDEAVLIIKKGIEYNPSFWQLRLYLAAIIYKRQGDTLGYIRLLEDALKFEDHPAMVERILGNIYEASKPAEYAAKYWVKVLNTSKHKDSRKHAYDRLQLMILEKRLAEPQKIIESIK